MAAKPSKRFKCPSHWTLAQRLDHYTDKSGGPHACWPWTGGRNEAGYGKLCWKGEMQRVHRLAWTEKNGPIPLGLDVLHECDNPPCRNESHLFLGTNDANVADMIAKGRQPKGEGHGCAKLADDQVRAIRAAAGTQRDIAARFGVSHGQVWRILRGRRWQHLA